MIAYRLPPFFLVALAITGFVSSVRTDEYPSSQGNFNLTYIRVAQAQISNTSETNLLQVGSQGEEVQKLQAQLKELGYLDLGVDGFYGEETKLAVSEFQALHNLKADGIATSETLDRLQNVLFEKYMKAGYEATDRRDYQTALQKFEQALDKNPNSYYAQKAINNVQTYIQNNHVTDRGRDRGEGFGWLILAVVLMFASLGAGLFLFVKRFNLEEENRETENLSNEDDRHYPKSHSSDRKTVIHKSNTVIQEEEPESSLIPSNNLSPTEVFPDDQSYNPLTVTGANMLAGVDRVEELIEDLQLINPTKRRKAIWELAQHADSRAMEPLVQLMTNADSGERGLILEAISQIGTRTFKPINKALAVSLQDPNPQVRTNAIRDLTRIYESVSQFSQRLSQAVEDGDKEVQETALWALEMLNQLKVPTGQYDLTMRQNRLNSSDRDSRS